MFAKLLTRLMLHDKIKFIRYIEAEILNLLVGVKIWGNVVYVVEN